MLAFLPGPEERSHGSDNLADAFIARVSRAASGTLASRLQHPLAAEEINRSPGCDPDDLGDRRFGPTTLPTQTRKGVPKLGLTVPLPTTALRSKYRVKMRQNATKRDSMRISQIRLRC
jgi:hypothetical protein